MKKIFTLLFGLVLTVALFAADRKPMVTVTSAKRYAIVIDGAKQFVSKGSTININDLFRGDHEIKVFKVKQGFSMRRPKLVATSQFRLGNSDVQINIDRFGQIHVTQMRDNDWGDHGFGRRHDRGSNYDKDHDRQF